MDDENVIHNTNNVDENLHGRPLIGFIRKVQYLHKQSYYQKYTIYSRSWSWCSSRSIWVAINRTVAIVCKCKLLVTI